MLVVVVVLVVLGVVVTVVVVSKIGVASTRVFCVGSGSRSCSSGSIKSIMSYSVLTVGDVTVVVRCRDCFLRA